MTNFRIGVRKSRLEPLDELSAGVVTLKLSLAEAIALIGKLGFRHAEDQGTAWWYGDMLVPYGPKTGARFAMPFTLTVDKWGASTVAVRHTEAHHFSRLLVELRDEFPIVQMPAAA